MKKRGKQDTIYCNIIISANRAIYFIILAIGLKLGFEYTGLTEIYANQLNSIFSVIWIVLGSFLILKILGSLTRHYGKAKIGAGISFLIQKIGRITIVITAIILVLYSFNVQISPLLAGLGIAGLAVAFALQDTLANFFSGIYLAAEQHIRPDDYVEIGNDIRGTVMDISWRTTRIRTFEGNVITIPNKKLGESTILNYNILGNPLTISVNIDAAYGSDADKVEKVIHKTTKKIIDEREECVKSYEPVVRLYELGESGLKFRVFLRTKTRGERFVVEHELRKALYKEFRKNKIEIPFPTKTIHLKKGS